MSRTMRIASVLLIALAAIAASYADTDKLFDNCDFEKGTLENWIPTGTAFDHQPIRGDVVQKRRHGMHSNHVGEYWVGTYEKSAEPGSKRYHFIQGDKPTGTLTSIPFEILGKTIKFRAGGGLARPQNGIFVALLVDGKEVMRNATMKAAHSPTMMQASWPASGCPGWSSRWSISSPAIAKCPRR